MFIHSCVSGKSSADCKHYNIIRIFYLSLSFCLPLSLHLKPVLWSRSLRMGCYNFLCPSLAAPEGQKYFNAYLVVCAYNPLYYTSALYTPSSNGCNRRNTCGRRDGEPQGCYPFETAEISLPNALCGKLSNALLCIYFEYCVMLLAEFRFCS